MDEFIWINKNVHLDKPDTFIKTDGKFFADEIVERQLNLYYNLLKYVVSFL